MIAVLIDMIASAAVDVAVASGLARVDTARVGREPSVKVERVGSPGSAFIEKSDRAANVDYTFLGASGSKNYLIVLPEEVQWVDVGMDAEYEVKSNTEWVIL